MFWGTALTWALDHTSGSGPDTVESLQDAVDAIAPVEEITSADSESQPKEPKDSLNALDGVALATDAAAAAPASQPGTPGATGGDVLVSSVPSGSTTGGGSRNVRLKRKQPVNLSPPTPLVNWGALDTTWGNRFGRPGSHTKRCKFLKLLKSTAELEIDNFAYQALLNKSMNDLEVTWKDELDAHKNMLYTARSESAFQKFKCVFHGRVTMFPSGKQHYVVTKAGGAELYMVPGDEFFCPAWHIPSSADELEITLNLEQTQLTCHVAQGRTRTPATLNVYYLEPKPDIEWSADVALVRPKLPSEDSSKLPEHLFTGKKLRYADLVFNAIGWKYQVAALSTPGADGTPSDGSANPSASKDDKSSRWLHIKNFTKL